MRKLIRYGFKGKKTYELNIPSTRIDDLLLDTGWGITRYMLAFEVAAWLKTNCSEEYEVKPGRWGLDIHFQSERDATLFWTFHA